MGEDPFLRGLLAHINFHADYQKDTTEKPTKDIRAGALDQCLAPVKDKEQQFLEFLRCDFLSFVLLSAINWPY